VEALAPITNPMARATFSLVGLDILGIFNMKDTFKRVRTMTGVYFCCFTTSGNRAVEQG
jgi:hypothetical protein